MAKEIIVTADSTVDLSDELLERFGIRVLPLYVEMDGVTYRDRLDVQADAIYDYYDRTGKLAHSSAGNIEDYTGLFEEITSQGKAVLHISLGSGMSSSHQNARIAAEDFEDVYVVDSCSLSTGIALVALRAVDLVKQGMEIQDIVTELNEFAQRVDASFVIDAIEYLRAGGRCSAVAAFGANLLKLKPSIQVTDGVMGVAKKYRGALSLCQKNYVADKLADLSDIDPERIFITHSGMSQEMEDAVVEQVKALDYFKEIFVTRAGCVISAHCGPGTVGILLARKTPLK